MKETVAAFDFDGTVTYRDTLFPFLIFVFGFWKTMGKLFLDLPHLIGFVLKISPRQKTKERILGRFFAGRDLNEIRTLGETFAAEKLDSHIRPEAIQRLRWHQSQGHRCVLISASLDVYLTPWADRMGFADLISSRFETNGTGEITGKLLGFNCWGPEKVRRLTEHLGPKKYQLYAYGDSRGDQELLALADHPFYRQMPTKEETS